MGEYCHKLIDRISDFDDQAKAQIRKVRKAKLDEVNKKARSGEIKQEEKDEIQSKLQESIDYYYDKVTDAVKEKKEELLDI